MSCDSPGESSPVIWALPPWMPFGFCWKSIVGYVCSSPSRMIAKRWKKAASEPSGAPAAFQSARPRSASWAVMSPNRSPPRSSKSIRTTG
jgi:hypothetical protein